MSFEGSRPQSYFQVKNTDRIFVEGVNQVGVSYSNLHHTKMNPVKEDTSKHSESLVIARADGIRYQGPRYRKIGNIRLFLQYDHNPNGWDVAYEAVNLKGKRVFNVAGEEVKGESLEKIIKKLM